MARKVTETTTGATGATIEDTATMTAHATNEPAAAFATAIDAGIAAIDAAAALNTTNARILAAASPGVHFVEVRAGDIALPRRFVPGMIVDERIALLGDLALSRQFVNNQNADADARAKRFVAAKTDAERDANRPLSAEEVAARYDGYWPEQKIRLRSRSDEIRAEAAYRVHAARVTQHNRAINAGEAPVFKAYVGQIVPLPKEGTVEADGVVSAMLTMPSFADRVQAQVDVILAEIAARKAGDGKPAAGVNKPAVAKEAAAASLLDD